MVKESTASTALFGAAERTLLVEYLEKYREDNSKNARKQFFQNAILPALKVVRPDIDEKGWTYYIRCVKNWYSRNGRGHKLRDRPRRPTRAQVVAKLHRQAVHTRTTELSHAKSGSPEWLKQWARAAGDVYRGLGTEEREKIDNDVEAFQPVPHDVGVQAKNCKRKLRREMDRFAGMMYRVCGSRLFIVEYHPTSDGLLAFAGHDYTAEFNPNQQSFSVSHADAWAEMKESFAEYTTAQIEASTRNPGTAADGPTRPTHRRGRNAVSTLVLPIDDQGYPLLPEYDEEEKLPLVKDRLRAFVNGHYQKASGLENRPAPWARLTAESSEFIAPEYLPVGLKLTEPTNLISAVAKPLIAFWRDRQKRLGPAETLRFHHVLGQGPMKDVLITAPYPRATVGYRAKSNCATIAYLRGGSTAPLTGIPEEPVATKKGKGVRRGKGKAKAKRKAPSKARASKDAPADDDVDVAQTSGPRSESGRGSNDAMASPAPSAAGEQSLSTGPLEPPRLGWLGEPIHAHETLDFNDPRFVKTDCGLMYDHGEGYQPLQPSQFDLYPTIPPDTGTTNFIPSPFASNWNSTMTQLDSTGVDVGEQWSLSNPVAEQSQSHNAVLPALSSLHPTLPPALGRKLGGSHQPPAHGGQLPPRVRVNAPLQDSLRPNLPAPSAGMKSSSAAALGFPSQSSPVAASSHPRSVVITPPDSLQSHSTAVPQTSRKRKVRPLDTSGENVEVSGRAKRKCIPTKRPDGTTFELTSKPTRRPSAK